MRVLLFTKLLTVGRFIPLGHELSERGIEVVVALPARDEERASPEELATIPARVEFYAEFEDPAFGRAATLLRRARDYAWYLRPEHRVASFNRRRALKRLVRAASGGKRRADPRWPDPVVEVEPEPVARVEAMLDELEGRLPPDPGVVRFLAAHEPDVVCVTPLIRPGLHQAEVVKAAAQLGMPTGFPVYSWDSLSNKGRMHCVPDRVWVWNEIHRREAVELHGVDPESVVVAGAPHWDAFFTLTPSQTRAEHCAAHGFDPARPIVLYLGSTVSVCPEEPPVVERWLDALRAAPEPLRSANVLVRPHPSEYDAPRWAGWVPPPGASLSIAIGKADQGLFDDLHHAAAAVGLNTSAQIEASIVGRPVYTFAAGDLAPGQKGSLHFHYLLEGNGGLFPYAATLKEHVDQLARGVEGDVDVEAIRRFSEEIVRPHGLGRPVVPILADEIVALARARAPAVSRA
jgi:hypothetical protein